MRETSRKFHAESIHHARKTSRKKSRNCNVNATQLFKNHCNVNASSESDHMNDHYL